VEDSNGRSGRIAWLTLAGVAFLLIAAGATGLTMGASAGSTAGTAAEASAGANAAEKKLDIVFVVDSSSSMTTIRYELARDFDVFGERLDGNGVDVRYGLVIYDSDVRIAQPLTDDRTAFTRAMNFETAGNLERASDALLRASEMDYRADAERVVVLVTNEDDDSSVAAREEAMATLASMNFVVVSHDEASISSCAHHSPPCDNSTANEPFRMAEAVGGNWIDVNQTRASILKTLGSHVTHEVLDIPEDGDPEYSQGDLGSSGTAEVTVIDLSPNRSVAEVGEPVEITMTLANPGEGGGYFNAYLHVKEEPDAYEFRIVGARRVTVPAGETLDVSFTYTFETADTYYFSTAGKTTKIEVVSQRTPTVTLQTDSGGNQTTTGDTEPNSSVRDTTERITATVADPIPGEQLTIPLNSFTTDHGVSARSLTITPASPSRFSVEVTRYRSLPNGSVMLPNTTSESRPSETATFPPGVTPLSVFRLDSTVPETTVESVAVGRSTNGTDGSTAEQNTTVSEKTLVYVYDSNDETWRPLDGRDATSGSAVEIGEQSWIAVTSVEPVFSVQNVTLRAANGTVGTPFETTVTVRNRGLADGTYTASLTVEGTIVTTADVFVPSGTARTVTLSYTPTVSGEYTVSVNETLAGTVTVSEAEPTATATPTSTPTATATEPPTESETGSTSTDAADGEETATASPTGETAGTTPTAVPETETVAEGKETTDGTAPGLTPVTAVVAVAVLGGALLLARRWE
jgi:uncharacterized protein (DUF58 family)